jgi:CCR4-NOT transcription complex subunit 3
LQQQPQPQQQQQQTAQRNAFPGSLSDLVASFETVKQKGEQFFIGDPSFR